MVWLNIVLMAPNLFMRSCVHNIHCSLLTLILDLAMYLVLVNGKVANMT